MESFVDSHIYKLRVYIICTRGTSSACVGVHYFVAMGFRYGRAEGVISLLATNSAAPGLPRAVDMLYCCCVAFLFWSLVPSICGVLQKKTCRPVCLASTLPCCGCIRTAAAAGCAVCFCFRVCLVALRPTGNDVMGTRAPVKVVYWWYQFARVQEAEPDRSRVGLL